MIRAAYRGLLWLHPPLFYERFAEEMVWIFDLNPGVSMRVALLFDALVSLLRQWLLRTGIWKFAVGLVVNATLIICSVLLPRQQAHCGRNSGMSPHATDTPANIAKPARFGVDTR
jgi:hypothetical protein